MEKCEMYDKGKAFDRNCSENSYREKIVTLCAIERGACPYGNEGHKIKDKEGKVMIICKTNANIDKKGLLKNI